MVMQRKDVGGSVIPAVEVPTELASILRELPDRYGTDEYCWLGPTETNDHDFYLGTSYSERFGIDAPLSPETMELLYRLGRLRYLMHRNFAWYREERKAFHLSQTLEDPRENRVLEIALRSLDALEMYVYTPRQAGPEHEEYSDRMVGLLEEAELGYAELGHPVLAQMERDRLAFGLVGQGLDDRAIELTESGAVLDPSDREEETLSRLLYCRSSDELRARNRCTVAIIKAFVALEDRQVEALGEHLSGMRGNLADARWQEGVVSRETVYTAREVFLRSDAAQGRVHAARTYLGAVDCNFWEYLCDGLASFGGLHGMVENEHSGERLIKLVAEHRAENSQMVTRVGQEAFALGLLYSKNGRHGEAVELLNDVIGRMSSPSVTETRHQLQYMLYQNLRALGHTDEALNVLEELYDSEKQYLRTRGRNRERFTRRSYEAELHRLRYVDLEAEKARTDAVLHAILPERIVTEVKERGSSTPEHFDEVTVLFADFVGYTAASAELSPGRLLAELTEIFSAFDEIIQGYGGTRIKTVGDGYMAACGVPEAIPDHADRMVRAALDMVEYLGHRRSETGQPWEARFGLNSGPVVAGIVGTTKYAYDIFGETVNVASRMESGGVASRVNVSSATRERLTDGFRVEPRGNLPVKGKGELPMYFVDCQA